MVGELALHALGFVTRIDGAVDDALESLLPHRDATCARGRRAV